MGKGVKQLRTVAAVAGALSIFCTPVIHAANGASPRKKMIVVLGDSVSIDYPLNPRDVYPALLKERLGQLGLEFDVVNGSENLGNPVATAHELARIACHPRPGVDNVDIFIIELAGIPNVGPLETNLQNIINQIKACQPQARIIICGIRAPGGRGRFLNKLSAMYSGLARKNQVALVPDILEGVTADPESTMRDNIHPNAAGQRIVAENIWRVLEPIARDVAAE
jgi:acyl-CoA thioesterase-1